MLYVGRINVTFCCSVNEYRMNFGIKDILLWSCNSSSGGEAVGGSARGGEEEEKKKERGAEGRVETIIKDINHIV